MKTLLAVVFTLTGASAFAQYQQPRGQIQTIQVQPGSTTIVNVMVPTQVTCMGSMTNQPNSAPLCTVSKERNPNTGSITYVVKQEDRELSDRRSTMESAIDDLNKLRQAGLCN